MSLYDWYFGELWGSYCKPVGQQLNKYGGAVITRMRVVFKVCFN